MVQLFVILQSWLLAADARFRDEEGQASAEYALVVMGAAFVALVIGVWAKETDRIGKLLDTIFATVTKLVRCRARRAASETMSRGRRRSSSRCACPCWRCWR